MISKYSQVDYQRLKDDIRQYLFLHNMDYRVLAEKSGYSYHSISMFFANNTPHSRFIANELINICKLNKEDYLK